VPPAALGDHGLALGVLMVAAAFVSVVPAGLNDCIVPHGRRLLKPSAYASCTVTQILGPSLWVMGTPQAALDHS